MTRMLALGSTLLSLSLFVTACSTVPQTVTLPPQVIVRTKTAKVPASLWPSKPYKSVSASDALRTNGTLLQGFLTNTESLGECSATVAALRAYLTTCKGCQPATSPKAPKP